MFKLMFLGVASVVAVGAASAQTAAPSTAPNWSGFYGGLQAGYGFDDGQRATVSGTSTGTANAIAAGQRAGSIHQNRQGFIGGGQIGWNLQRGRFVFGPEADFDYTHERGTTNSNTLTAAGQPQNAVMRNRMDWMGSARLRAGYTVGDGLIYGTGGYAFGKVRGSAASNAPNGAENYAGRDSYTAQGWLAGLGAEIRPWHDGTLSKVGIGAEATYYDLGKSHIVANATSTANTGAYVISRNTRGINGVVKVNYAF